MEKFGNEIIQVSVLQHRAEGQGICRPEEHQNHQGKYTCSNTTLPVIVGMNGNTVPVAPGFDVKPAGSLFLEKGSPSGEFCLTDLQICIHRDNLRMVRVARVGQVAQADIDSGDIISWIW